MLWRNTSSYTPTSMLAVPQNQTLYLTKQQQQQQQQQPLINPGVLRIYQLISYGIVSEAVVVFGIVTNIMNIICFIKQGFKESINVNLLCLAISDLGFLITYVWPSACMVPQLQETELSFDLVDTAYFISSVPHVVFTRVTAVITAFITLEKCLCVTIPLKVASIFSPKRVAIINACIFVALIISGSPVYASGVFVQKYHPEKNRTILSVAFTKDREIKEQISFIINSVLVPFSALSIIIVCMVTMVITLQKQAKWRQQLSRTKDCFVSEREQRLVKMIVMISTLFVASFCPSVLLFLTITIEPKFAFGGKYVDFSLIAYGIIGIAESTNSAVNIIIYYKMSSKYRACFRQVFCGLDVKVKSKIVYKK